MKSFRVVAIAMVVLGAGFFIQATRDEAIGQLWATLGFISLSAALLSWLTSYRNRRVSSSFVPSSLSSFLYLGDRQRRRWVSGLTFIVASILAVVAVAWFRWKPHADFDITGILWLMQNVVPLAILAVLLIVAFGSLVSWFNTFRKPR